MLMLLILEMVKVTLTTENNFESYAQTTANLKKKKQVNEKKTLKINDKTSNFIFFNKISVFCDF